MKNATLQRLILLLVATAIGLCLAIHCRAQQPTYIPDCCAQTFALTRQLATARDSLTLLNTRVDTLLAADKRVRVALKAEADAAAAEANARLTVQEGQLGNVGGMLSVATTRADKAEADLSRYRPRTWAGRQLRHVWNGSAWLGLGTVGYTVLRVFVFR